MTNQATKLVLDVNQVTGKPPTTADTKAEISVNGTPKFVVDTGTDWAVILGSGVTIFVVIVTTWLQLQSFKKTLKSNESIAEENRETEKSLGIESADFEKEKLRSEFISTSRQNWINNLRDTISEYVSAALAVSDLHEYSQGTKPHRKQLDDSRNIELALEWGYRLHEAKSKALQLKTKIYLLANPYENEFQELFAVIDDLHKKAVFEAKTGLETEAKSVVEKSQIILKKEWERVKKLEGLTKQNDEPSPKSNVESIQ